MARRAGRQNQLTLRQSSVGQSVEEAHSQQAHHPRNEHCSRRLRSPGTHQPTQRDSLNPRRRIDNHRHLPQLPHAPHRHARSRIGHMPRLPQGMGCASNQSSPRPTTLANPNHRHTQRCGQGAETIRPDRIAQPHQPMDATGQTARHADRTQAAVQVQPRRVGRTT